MRCPGQDLRYWNGDAIFEVPCPKCGSAVEFFKDETSRRCSRCGHPFRNPKIALGCAEWCAEAERCIGFAPEGRSTPNSREGALAGRLIRAVKEEFEADQARLAHALLVFQHAKELLSKEGGDPRVILTAALLLETGMPGPTRRPSGEAEASSRARLILARSGLDDEAIARVCRIVDAWQTSQQVDTIEFSVVADADVLARLAAGDLASDPSEQEDSIADRLRTAAGKQRAQSLFRA